MTSTPGTSDDLRARAQLRLADHDRDQLAPMVIWDGMLQLADGKPVLASLVQANSTDEGTEWKVVWVTDNRVIVATASKAEPDWNAHDTDQKADHTAVWARRRADIVTIELADLATEKQSFVSNQWVSTVGSAAVAFADGFTLNLPLLPDQIKRHNKAELAKVIEALSGGW